MNNSQFFFAPFFNAPPKVGYPWVLLDMVFWLNDFPAPFYPTGKAPRCTPLLPNLLLTSLGETLAPPGMIPFASELLTKPP